MWPQSLLLWVFAPVVKSEVSCSGCISKDVLKTAAYGINLSLDQLTSAVKFANGTILPLSKIKASDQYREVMQKCLNVPDNGARQHIFGSAYKDPWIDHVNESVVTTLSQEIHRLISSIDDIENIAVSLPTAYTNFLAHHVKESLVRLGLSLSEPYSLGPRDLMAISAYESGFCRFGNITPPEHCGPNVKGRRNERYADKLILVVEHDQDELVIASVLVFEGETLFPINRATLPLPGNDGSVDWKDATQWIATRIGSHRGLPNSPKFNRLVLIEDCAADAGFESAVWAALRMEHDVVDSMQLEVDRPSRLDPEFVAALGAAQIVKDFRDAPKPIGCSETNECKKIRKEVFQVSLKTDPEKREAKDEL